MAPRCYRHPDREALFECAECGRLICEECMTFGDEGDDEVRCPACCLETLGDVAEEEMERHEREAKEGARVQIGMRGKPGAGQRKLVNRAYVVLFFFLLMIYGGVHWYLSVGVQTVSLSDPEMARLENPAIEMIVVAAALLEYSADHGGEFPESISDLFPGYVDRKPTVLQSEIYYDYRRNPRVGFVLLCPQPTRYGFDVLMINGNGEMILQ